MSGNRTSSNRCGSNRSTSNVKCTICSERYKSTDKIYGGTCGHVFHWQCLQRWREESNQCPICRSARREFHQIYLDFEDADEQSGQASLAQEQTSSSSMIYGESEFGNLLYEAHLFRDEIEYLNTRIEQLTFQHIYGRGHSYTSNDSD
ncbi:E3 ubiquitin-protein ligase trul-1 [Drosophila grimshawi]|uniref:GH24407 n=1 Tax=Drosophila grimshawi TaxID=7222 RepID=B4JM24_DROGR|nr:E3 ubiquitin-protein ligase trul-1 [Drosophila grimshawi]EDV91785.1 GH24407 [Drosophila grimshawi]